MIEPRTTVEPCPAPDVLAAFIDGHLAAADRAGIETHLVRCSQCYEVFTEALRSMEAMGRGTTRSNTWYFVTTIAAALILVVGTVTWLSRANRSQPIDDLVAAVGTNRFVEARLSAPFAWGVAPSPLRGDAPPRSLAVERAVLELKEAVASRRTAETVHAAGVGQLALGEVAGAVTLLEEAATLAPDSGPVKVDLAAALLARWRAQRVEYDATRALHEAEAAVQLTPRDPAALFNKALALEALDLRGPAVRAWQAYLDVDARSEWAAEARERMERLSKPEGRSSLPNATHVYAEAEQQVFPAWVAHTLDGSTSIDLASFRRRAIEAGADQQLIDEVDALIGSGAWTEKERRNAAVALARRSDWLRQYRDGDHEQSEASARQWLTAASATRLPTLPAHVALALTEFSSGSSDAAMVRFRQIQPQLEARNYWRAVARLHNVFGVLQLQSTVFSVGMEEYQHGLSAATRAGDLELVAVLHALIGEALADQGDIPAAWHHLAVAFGHLDAVRNPRARFGILATAGIMAAEETPGASYRLADELLHSTRDWDNASGQILAHLQRAVALARLNRPSAALEDLAKAREWQHRLRDENLASQFETEIDVAEARVMASLDPQRSHSAATRALAAFERQRSYYRFASLLLLRGRLARSMGDVDAAERDWDHGARLIEGQGATINDERLRISRLDRVWELFAELVAVRASRPLEALETLERLHARELLAALEAQPEAAPLRGAELYSWLPRHVTVVSYAVLPTRLLIWVTTAEGVRIVVREVPQRRLGELVAAYRVELESGSATTAADALSRQILPDELPSSTDHILAVVPDGPLHAVSFATLPVSGGGALIERATVLVAPSVSVLKVASAAPKPTRESALLVGYGAPFAPAGLPALPQADAEVRALSSLYPDARTLTDAQALPSAIMADLPRASTIHIAAHALIDRAHPIQSRFVVAPENNRLLDAAALRSTRLRRGSVVMLSACESAAGRTFYGEGPISLVRPFLAAGARAVIGALWPIPDNGTPAFSAQVHALMRRSPPAHALAVAQRQAITAGAARRQWGAFVVYGGFN